MNPFANVNKVNDIGPIMWDRDMDMDATTAPFTCLWCDPTVLDTSRLLQPTPWAGDGRFFVNKESV